MSNNNLEKIIKPAILNMLLYKPFFGFIVSKMNLIEDKDSKVGSIKTAATDGRNIYYSDEFMSGLDVKERVFVFAHEIMHCVLDSFGRKHSRDAQYWNMATDYAINAILVKESVGKMPKMGLFDRKYENMTAEQIYDDLVKNNAPKQDTLDVHLDMSQGSGDESDGGDGKDGKQKGQGGLKIDQKTLKENAEEFKKLIVEAAQRTKMAGQSLGSLEDMIGELINPRINWKQLLTANLQSIFKTDITWQKPNRRSLDGRVIMPSFAFEDTVDVCVSIDTSGSISDEQRIVFLSEIAGILQYYKNFKLKIWCFDTAVHNMQEFEVSSVQDIVNYKPGGGGGTDIKCNFDFMIENNIKPKQFIVLTDGYNFNNDWGPEGYCPTTWIIHSNPRPDVPWGDHAIFEELVGED